MIYCIVDCHIGLFSQTPEGHIPAVFWDDGWEYEHTAEQSWSSTKTQSNIFLSNGHRFKLIRLDAPTAAFSLFNKNLEAIIDRLKSHYEFTDDDSILFSFGEIDCNDHIIKKCIKDDMKLNLTMVEELVDMAASGYKKMVEKYIEKGFNIIVYGPPAGAVFDEDYPKAMVGNTYQWNFITLLFTKKLEEFCKEFNIDFITMYYDMVDEKGFSISKYLHKNNSHVNASHCLPTIMRYVDKKAIVPTERFDELYKTLLASGEVV